MTSGSISISDSCAPSVSIPDFIKLLDLVSVLGLNYPVDKTASIRNHNHGGFCISF